MSSGDTSFVIKDQMSWSPSENGTEINGHGFVPNVPKTQISSNTVDEEDPYEGLLGPPGPEVQELYYGDNVRELVVGGSLNRCSSN